MDRERIIKAVLDVLYPPHATGGKRIPIFEWGHEETPTADEMQKLAEEIADAVLAADVRTISEHGITTDGRWVSAEDEPELFVPEPADNEPDA